MTFQNLSMKNIQLKDYLLKIKLAERSLADLTTEEKATYLRDIYFSHVKTFPYSNFDLRHIARQHPIKRTSLSFFSYKTLLSSEHDSYCFQLTALLGDALIQSGYDTSFCEARVLMGASINAPEILAIPPTHLILVVTLDDKKFLLDPGMGSSAPRYPIPITDKNDVIIQNNDEFKFYPTDNLYVLERKTTQGWLRLMQTDLVPLSESKAQMNLLKLGFHPTPISIRDYKTVVGIITDHGRKSLIWDEQSNQLKFSKQEGKTHQQRVVSSFEEGNQILAEEFNIHHISAQKLEEYCSKTTCPLPIKPWTIDFPIDDNELTEMEQNLRIN